jgi:CRISPR-associated protein Csx16
MKRVFFVNRHERANWWVRHHASTGTLQLEVTDFVEHLDLAQVNAGDVVMGTLPVSLAAKVMAKGARFIALEMDIPQERRGEDLTATEMAKFGAALVEYEVKRLRPHLLAGKPVALPPESGNSLWVMLVSDETSPNLIAYRMERSSHVLLVTTASMKNTGQHLQKVLETDGAKAWGDGAFDEGANPNERLKRATELIDRAVAQGFAPIHVNLTGGTKAMFVAFWEAAQHHVSTGRVLAHYVDTAQKRVECLTYGNSAPLQAVMNVKDLITLRGSRAEHAETSSPDFLARMQREELANWLLNLDGTVLGRLNGLWQDMETALKTASKKNLNSVAIENPKSGLQVRYELLAPIES